MSDSKFTPERCAAIVDAISHQVPFEYACEANGVGWETVKSWCDTGREHRDNDLDSPYTQFLMDYKKAEMRCIREHIDLIQARPDNWEAHAWLLERRWGKVYAL